MPLLLSVLHTIGRKEFEMDANSTSLIDIFALGDCGSLIVRQCERRVLGRARRSSSSLRSAIDSCLDSLDLIADAENVGKLLRRLPNLQQLQTDRPVDNKGCFRHAC